MYEHRIAEYGVFCTNVIPEKLLQMMIDEVKSLNNDNFEQSTVGNDYDYTISPKIRNSKISWWFEEHWACSLISHYINIANREYWEYDLTHLESIQISKYDVNDHYNWHCDYGVSDDSRYTRKLSSSIIISDPSDYEGGDLQFISYSGETITAPKERGNIIIFDSRVPHRVTPVTKGTRISLVSWMKGPKLR